ncbi:hypothetical protein HY68_32050 [Streptomyces sp. AcH 505]|nr:hypothetical protein HY68_32050 [Streptomyces sp. AcH 505]
MRVRVDGEQRPGRDRAAQQPPGRIEPFGTAVDLDGRPGLRACGEDRLGVELRLRAALAGQQAAGAVPEDIGVRIAYGGDQPARHGAGVHPQLRVRRDHHQVQPGEEFGLLVQ